MRYKEIVEARKNPEQNPKRSVHAYLREYLPDAETVTGFDGERFDNLFLSFTSVDKLGINPRSRYNTPIGIYSYSAEYVTQVFSDNQPEEGEDSIDVSPDTLPFAGSSKYANFFSVNEGSIKNVVVLSMYGDLLEHFYPILKRAVKENYPTAFSQPISRLANRDRYDNEEDYQKKIYQLKQDLLPTDLEFDIVDSVTDSYQNSRREALLKTDSGRFWYMFFMTAQKLSNRTDQNSSVIWTKLFLECGIHGVVDPGEGIIHKNEPAQAVFFSNSFIDVIDRVPNKYSTEYITNAHANAEEKLFNTSTSKAAIGLYQRGKLNIIDFIFITSERYGFMRDIADAIKPEDYPTAIYTLVKQLLKRPYLRPLKYYLRYISNKTLWPEQVTQGLTQQDVNGIILIMFGMNSIPGTDLRRHQLRFSPSLAKQLISALNDKVSTDDLDEAMFSTEQFKKLHPLFQQMVMKSGEKTKQIFGINQENR